MSAARVSILIPTRNRGEWLRESLSSALAQSYPSINVVVGDNASDDETTDVVRSFDDPRLSYVRRPVDVGMLANMNALIASAETELLVVLPDDDLLYEHHVDECVAALDASPAAGFAHTHFDVLSSDGERVMADQALVGSRSRIEVESGRAFIRRSMQMQWTICWPTAVFRKEALLDGELLRPGDEPAPDFALLMRIARRWDAVCVGRCLGATRVHASSHSARDTVRYGLGHDRGDAFVLEMARLRTEFLDVLQADGICVDELRSLARASVRKDRVARLANSSYWGRPRRETLRELQRMIQHDPRVLAERGTWRLLSAEFGGRALRRRLPRKSYT